jgi:hypothetical protein
LLPEDARREDREPERIGDLADEDAIEIVAGPRGHGGPEQEVAEVAVDGREALGRRVANAVVAAGVGGDEERGGFVDRAALN